LEFTSFTGFLTLPAPERTRKQGSTRPRKAYPLPFRPGGANRGGAWGIQTGHPLTKILAFRCVNRVFQRSRLFQRPVCGPEDHRTLQSLPAGREPGQLLEGGNVARLAFPMGSFWPPTDRGKTGGIGRE
jgi:hypothetical protein